jgi:hypothetical protein
MAYVGEGLAFVRGWLMFVVDGACQPKRLKCQSKTLNQA